MHAILVIVAVEYAMHLLTPCTGRAHTFIDYKSVIPLIIKRHTGGIGFINGIESNGR